MKYKVIALDLDGTLTNSQKCVTEETKRTVQEAARKGCVIVLASGRPLIGIHPIAEKLNLSEHGGYILAYNGGQIVSCKDQETVFQSMLPTEYYAEICQIAREYGVQPLTYNGSSVVAETRDDFYVKKEAFNNSVDILEVKSLEEYVNYSVAKFMIVGEPEKLKVLHPVLKDRYSGKIGVFFSEPYFMEVVPLGIEKAGALSWLLKYLDYQREELMAIGDGLNDLPMLEYAGFSVAMGNAYDSVKEKADYITTSNDEDGVARAIEKWILEEDKEC